MRHVRRSWPTVPGCKGPLVWFDAGHTTCPDCGDHSTAAVLECAACGYIAMTGNWHDDAHTNTPIMREGYAYG